MMPAIFVKSVVRLSEMPQSNKAHVAMVGRSNVGKSSLINNLTNQKNLARVSSDPGRTQTINFYEMDKRFFLVDLPGYGYAKASKEKRADLVDMICDYLKETPKLAVAFVIIDARIPLSPLDQEMLDWLQVSEIPFVIILNKTDKAKKTELKKAHEVLDRMYPGVRQIEHSMHSGKNRNEILGVISKAISEA